jgi:hypothetical protein
MQKAGLMNASDPARATELERAPGSKAGRRRSTLVLCVLLLLIVAGAIRSAIATRLDSLNIDEAYHITAGVSYARLGDYRLNPEHPPLVKLWVGTFLTRGIFQLPPLVQMGDKVGERHYTAGAVYLTNDPDRVQERARLAMFLLNGILLLGFGLAVWRVLHPGLAIVAVTFLVIDPTVAAHWPMVLTDLPVALLSSTAFLLAFQAFRSWRILDVVLAGFALGLALGAKHSAPAVAIAIFAMGAGMALLGKAEGKARALRFARVGLAALVAWMALWGFYRFRFNESPAGIDTFNRPLAEKIADVNSGVIRGTLAAMSKVHFLPRSYLWGFADVVRAGVEGRMYSIYFWDRSYIRRTPFYFFPGVVFFKLPLGLTALVLFGTALLLTRRVTREWRAGVVAMTCFAAFLFVLLAGANSGYSGIRHALPVFPPLALLAACGVLFAVRSRARWPRIVCAVALIGALASALPVIRPWEYYNELAGGSSGAYRHFSDDGIEDGQRVKELADYYHRELEPKGIVPYIEYWFFYNDEEFARRGIRSINTEWDKDESLDVNDVISGTVIMDGKWMLPNPWSDYSSLREAQPVKRIGNLFIYQGNFQLADARAWRIYFRGVANLYADKPDLEKAEKQFREAAAVAPTIFFASLELGNLLTKRGARDEAIAAYEGARVHSPPTEEVGRLLEAQIERLKKEDPKMLPPVRDPYLE